MKRLLVLAALILGAVLTIPATAAFASVTPPPVQGQQWDNGNGCGDEAVWVTCDRDHSHLVCHPVLTPYEPNLPYVMNTTGVKVIVTLYGTYYWVQVKDTTGHITFLGPTTTTVILLPGWSISVAWHGDPGHIAHDWHWIGEKCIRIFCHPRCHPKPCDGRFVLVA